MVRTRMLVVGLVVISMGLAGLPMAAAQEAGPATPVLNEFSVSTAGTDVEFVEVVGDSSSDYSGYSILEVEGDSGSTPGVVDEVIPVGSTDAAGFWLGSLPANALENGTVSLLVVAGFTGAVGDDLDVDDDGALDVTPWSALVDAVAVSDGGSGDLTYGVPVLGPNYDGVSSFAPGGASRIPDGVDTDTAADWVRNDFDLAGIPGFTGSIGVGEAYNTPGAPNQAYTEEPPLSPPVLNEFSVSTAGTDVEFVEVVGDASSDYSGYSILEIEGDSGSTPGVVDEVIPVGSTDGSGFWLVSLPSNALENGTITLLLVEGFTGALGDDLDTDNDGTLDVTPWSAVVDAVAVSDGGGGDLTYGVPVLGQNYDGVSFTPGGASRIPDGVDTDTAADWVRNDFDLAGIPGFTGSITVGEAYNTPGEPNQAYEEPPPPSEACGDPFTPIYDVQGDGLASPIAGTEVAVEGVVVGDFQEGLDGYYLQDPTGDGNAASSDGVFVYAPGGVDVATGDLLRVRGTVSEFFGMTQMSAGTVWTCSTANPLPGPATVSLPVSSLDDFEPFEGMYVTIPQTLTISEFFNFDRFGEIVLTTDRQIQPTAVYEPGSPEAAALAEANRLSRITLDDGRLSQNPDPAIHPNGEEFTLDNLFRGGDTVANVTGVLDYRFSLYRIQPTEGADYTSENPRPSGPPDVGGDLQVASFNVLNYFTTLNSRGANTPEEFERQEAKIVAALADMDADVVGLIEIENNEEAIDTLVTALNDVVGEGTYDYVDTGVIGSDEIRVALIYKPASVTAVGDHAILDSTVDARFLDDKNRPVLAQTFQSTGTGGVFTVAVNHLKSKGSACDDVGDPDTGDGSGNCNLTRTAAAEAMVDWLASDPTGSGDADFLIIGDLNSYDKEDPIDALIEGADDVAGTGDDYTDLVAAYQGEYAYSYVFDGQLGYLDHALASDGLMAEVTGAAVWHINADEADLIDYDMTYKQDAQDALYAPDAFRSSDHDPVIVGLDVCDEIAPTIDVEVSPDMLWPPNHKYVEVTATVTASDDVDTDVEVTLVSVTSNEPDDGYDDGNTVDDIVIVDDTSFLLRAERSGSGTGRYYTITYVATDDCGNQTYGVAQVTVPLYRGR